MSPRKMRSAPRGSKLGWPVVTAKIPPQAEAQLAHLEASREIQRTDAIREAVEMYLQSYGYNPAA